MASVDPNLHPISLPGRDPILPDVYTCLNHPLVPLGKTCIVLIHDTSVKAMRTMHDWEKKQQIPSGSDRQLKALGAPILVHICDACLTCFRPLGLLQVPEDTLIFARDINSTNPRDDALQAWLTPACAPTVVDLLFF
jgi:hypothetical protein